MSNKRQKSILSYCASSKSAKKNKTPTLGDITNANNDSTATATANDSPSKVTAPSITGRPSDASLRRPTAAEVIDLSNSDTESLLEAFLTPPPSARSNKGNKEARGHTSDQKRVYEEEFQRLLTLAPHSYFWCKDSANAVLTPIPASTYPFFSFTDSTAIKRFQENRNARNNTNATKATRSQDFILRRVLGDDGQSQKCGGPDNDSYVLCKLLPSEVSNKEALEQQMAEIEGLPIGTRLWIRMNNKNSVSTDPRPRGNERAFEMPTITSVRSRLSTKRVKSIQKLRMKSACKKWELVEMVRYVPRE